MKPLLQCKLMKLRTSSSVRTRSGGIFDLDEKKKYLATLSAKRLDPDYWSRPDEAQLVEKEISEVKSWVDVWNEIQRYVDDLETLVELAEEEEDNLDEELEVEAKALSSLLEKVELRSMLSGDDDHRNAILTINPGAGGTESQDWAEMLLRMYTRWGEKNGHKVTMLDYQPGDVAGIKSASLRFEGPMAFGYLKAESGVHRLVRISPFDSSGRRHTSFSSVFVFPEIDDTIDVELRPDQVEMQRFHSGGKGGQNVNKVETGVRLIWTGELSNGEKARVVAE